MNKSSLVEFNWWSGSLQPRQIVGSTVPFPPQPGQKNNSTEVRYSSRFGAVGFKFSSRAGNFHRFLILDKVERLARIRACADEGHSLWKWWISEAERSNWRQIKVSKIIIDDFAWDSETIREMDWKRERNVPPFSEKNAKLRGSVSLRFELVLALAT